jgi:shikimate kinase
MVMARADSTRRVFLIGFMGAGKTSAGKALARRLQWPFHDLDDVIERRAGKSVAAIFAEQGEPGFRKMESAALQDLLKQPDAGNMIVALGGGAFVQPENRSTLARAGAITVLLEAPLEELQRRCAQDSDNGGDKRPLAREASKFAELFEQRRAAYQSAQFHVTTMDKSVEQVAMEIERILADVTKPEVAQ